MSLEDFEIIFNFKEHSFNYFSVNSNFIVLIARFFCKVKALNLFEQSLILQVKLLRIIYKLEFLPKNKDELYVLSENINNLLNQIESAIDREKNNLLQMLLKN